MRATAGLGPPFFFDLDNARRTLVRYLEQRFGPLPEPVRRRIDGISSIEDLTQFTLRAGAAASLSVLADAQE